MMHRYPVTRSFDLGKMLDDFIMKSGPNVRTAAAVIYALLGSGTLAFSFIWTSKTHQHMKEWIIFIYWFVGFPTLILGIYFLYKAVKYTLSLSKE